MVMLSDTDINTREVLDWEGITLLHFMGSSCSQKSRIFLNLKGIPWNSRHVDLSQRENYSEWFMGINPRGLIPVLVDDGNVIIESNDILQHLEKKFPQPPLIPAGTDEEAKKLLDEEDELHLDLRAISMRYFFPGAKARPDEALEQYQQLGSGTVGGVADAHKEVELEFHRQMAANNGITDEQIRQAVSRFRAAFEQLEERLQNNKYLLGDDLSVVDIAWYIYCLRLAVSGYPLHGLHPRLGAWYDHLNSRPEFNKEVAEPPPLVQARAAMQAEQNAANTSLAEVSGITA